MSGVRAVYLILSALPQTVLPFPDESSSNTQSPAFLTEISAGFYWLLHAIYMINDKVYNISLQKCFCAYNYLVTEKEDNAVPGS